MQNSKEYSQKIQKLYRTFKRQSSKVKKISYEEPVDSLVYGVVSENISKKAADAAFKQFTGYFVDWNDMRVSRPEEIIEILSESSELSKVIAVSLITMLRAIFETYNGISLEHLKKMGKRPARKALEKIEGSTCFVVDYCMLTSLYGHAIPLTKKMVEYLRKNELIHPESDEQEVEGFLTKQIRSENAYEFYSLLRQHSERSRARKKKKSTKKAEVTKKTAVKKKKKAKKRKKTTRKG